MKHEGIVAVGENGYKEKLTAGTHINLLSCNTTAVTR